MVLTKREAARKVLAAIEAEKKLKPRAVIGGVATIIIAALLAIYSQIAFAIAGVLLSGLVMQIAFERIKEQIEVSKEVGLKFLSWSEEDLLKDDVIQKLEKIINK